MLNLVYIEFINNQNIPFNRDQFELNSKFRLMCEGGCIYLSPMSRGAPPVPSKTILGIDSSDRLILTLNSSQHYRYDQYLQALILHIGLCNSHIGGRH